MKKKRTHEQVILPFYCNFDIGKSRISMTVNCEIIIRFGEIAS